MGLRNIFSILPACSYCGTTAHSHTARFCRHCGAGLTEADTNPPARQQPRPEKYDDVSIPRMELSCPQCGYAMSFGFRDVCRQCGARLVLIPRLLHWGHYRVYVAGLDAAVMTLLFKAIKLVVIIAVFMLLAKACAQ